MVLPKIVTHGYKLIHTWQWVLLQRIGVFHFDVLAVSKLYDILLMVANVLGRTSSETRWTSLSACLVSGIAHNQVWLMRAGFQEIGIPHIDDGSCGLVLV